MFFPQKNKYRNFDYKNIKTHFFWRDYCEWLPYNKERHNPEYIHSWHNLYVFDGTVNYWDGNTHKYDDITNIPNDETPTDRARRNVYYTKELCEWGLLDCNCSSNGICLQILNDYNYQSKKEVSISTVNTLEERMNCYKELL